MSKACSSTAAISTYFITNADRMEAALDELCILITDKKISAISDILPVLEKLLQVTKNLVLLAEDIDGEALATLVVNKLCGTLSVLGVKAPGFGVWLKRLRGLGLGRR